MVRIRLNDHEKILIKSNWSPVLLYPFDDTILIYCLLSKEDRSIMVSLKNILIII
jgi:hypothetical protein